MRGYDYAQFDAASAVAKWPEDWRDDYEERAAIMEYDAGFERKEAEFRAFLEVKRRKDAAEK